MARIDDAASADLDSLTAFLTARQNVGSAARPVLVKGNGVEAFSHLATHAPITPKVLEEEIGGPDDQRVWFTFPRASYSVRWAVRSSPFCRPERERPVGVRRNELRGLDCKGQVPVGTRADGED